MYLPLDLRFKAHNNDINTFVPNDTIINDESVYSSIKGDSEHNYKDKESFMGNRVYFNDSINNSSIRYDSNENFVHRLTFSESSSSISNKW